jgi:hypothetical protein
MDFNARRVLLAIPLAIGLGVIGAACGGVVASLDMSGMGWDQMGRTLGGVMIGFATGVVLSIPLARKLPLRGLRVISLVAFVIGAFLLGYGYLQSRRNVGADDPSRQYRAVTAPGGQS